MKNDTLKKALKRLSETRHQLILSHVMNIETGKPVRLSRTTIMHLDRCGFIEIHGLDIIVTDLGLEAQKDKRAKEHDYSDDLQRLNKLANRRVLRYAKPRLMDLDAFNKAVEPFDGHSD